MGELVRLFTDLDLKGDVKHHVAKLLDQLLGVVLLDGPQ